MTRAIMLDMETLATGTDASIVSIGAVDFDPYSPEFAVRSSFYQVVAVGQGRDVSAETLWWWMQQSEEAQKIFDPSIGIQLDAALLAFDEWLAAWPMEINEVWSLGADFDIPIIVSVLESEGMEPRWKYKAHRCLRTVRALYPQVVRPVFESGVSVSHNALDDALNQARHLHLIMKFRAAEKADARRNNQFQSLEKDLIGKPEVGHG